MSQTQLADELGLARVTISRMETGAAPIERRTELALTGLESIRAGGSGNK